MAASITATVLLFLLVTIANCGECLLSRSAASTVDAAIAPNSRSCFRCRFTALARSHTNLCSSGVLDADFPGTPNGLNFSACHPKQQGSAQPSRPHPLLRIQSQHLQRQRLAVGQSPTRSHEARPENMRQTQHPKRLTPSLPPSSPPMRQCGEQSGCGQLRQMGDMIQ